MTNVAFVSRKRSGLLLVLFLLFVCFSCNPTQTGDEKEIISVIEKFFDGFAAKDTTVIWETLLREGTFQRVNEDGNVTVVSHAAFLRGIASTEDDLLEIIEEPETRIQGRLAFVWVPYVLYRNGERHHCGVNAFNMVKTPEGWMIAEIVYSYETRCGKYPLNHSD